MICIILNEVVYVGVVDGADKLGIKNLLTPDIKVFQVIDEVVDFVRRFNAHDAPFSGVLNPIDPTLVVELVVTRDHKVGSVEHVDSEKEGAVIILDHERIGIFRNKHITNKMNHLKKKGCEF